MSQITSSAINPASAPVAAPARPPAADAAAKFEGLLFAQALAPLSESLGVLGDVLTSTVATEVARGSHDAFYRHLQTLAERDSPDLERK